MSGRIVGYVVLTTIYGPLDLRWDGELFATEDEAQASADEARSSGWPAAVGTVTAPELTPGAAAGEQTPEGPQQ